MSGPCVNLGGFTTLGTLAALMEGARLVVCNDTGISHLAAALRTPSVVVFVSSDPRRWAPLDATRHRPVHATASIDPVRDVLTEAGRVLDLRRW